MKAAVIEGAGRAPVYGEFREPAAAEGCTLVEVRAAALSHFSKSRSAGAHYSAEGMFPSIAGAEGVGRTSDGRRVYFVLPEAPFGALAERCLVKERNCVAIPESVDDVTAAAIANPGMSAWAALVERARLKPGETVLVNGATGSAGRMAVQVAKHLGAGKVIATGRDETRLAELLALGADAVIPLGGESGDAKRFERALRENFAGGINVVLDYLWGGSAQTIIVAIAKAIDDATPVRFVHVGAASGDAEILLAGAALRSSAIELMGSGVKSVPMPKLLGAIGRVFEIAGPAGLQVETRAMPLAEIAAAWAAPGQPRVVVTIP